MTKLLEKEEYCDCFVSGCSMHQGIKMATQETLRLVRKLYDQDGGMNFYYHLEILEKESDLLQKQICGAVLGEEAKKIQIAKLKAEIKRLQK